MKKTLSLSICFLLILCSGCGNKDAISSAYDLNNTNYGLLNLIGNSYILNSEASLFSKNLCVVGEDVNTELVDTSQAEAVCLFDITSNETVYAKNVHKQIFPASTTKTLTALLTLKYGNMADTVTMTEEDLNLPSDASKCGLKVGDTLTVEQLLYGLMLRSANEAANALARYVSGSTEDFAQLMNQELAAMGATNSHFINANGLHDDSHYTTVYDMYLIFNSAIAYEEFRKIIGTVSYDTSYTLSDGSPMDVSWDNVLFYYSGKAQAPEGITVLGGKTGTTDTALSCLVLLTVGPSGHEYVSIIMKAKERGILYEEMTALIGQET